MNNESFEKYNAGPISSEESFSVITLVLLVGAPFMIGLFLGAMPDLPAVGKGFLSVGIIWFVSSIVEFSCYTPMLGAGGGYLAFITGNLINMKIPCAINARDQVGAKSGTRKMRSSPLFPLQPLPLLRFWYWLSASFYWCRSSLFYRAKYCSPLLKM